MELLNYFKQKLVNIEKEYNISFMSSNIVVAVSTGVDSSSLLDLLIKAQEKYKYNIVIAHVNHGKRRQSDIEEEYIKNYAKVNKLNIEVLELHDGDFSGVNFQEEARNKRIEFFKKVLEKYNSKYLFLAHQLNDEAETIIMHLMRNSSLDGLCGMNDVSINKGYYFIRPLIDIKKEELYDYAKSNDVKYFEDASNFEDHYTRNQVRHYLVDDSFKDNMNEALNRYKTKMNEAKNVLQKYRDEVIKNCINLIDNKIVIDLDKFNDEYFDIKIDCLFEVLMKYDFSKSNIEEILKIINQNGNVKNQYKNILILKEYNVVSICENYIENSNDIELTFDKLGKYRIDDKHEIEIRKLDDFGTEEKTCEIDVSNKDIIWYNDTMLPLVIRKKQEGDRIKIKDGTKKVNELLVDLKVPLSVREKVMVLIDKNGDIISILGIRKSYLLNEMKENKLIKNLIIETNYYNNI